MKVLFKNAFILTIDPDCKFTGMLDVFYNIVRFLRVKEYGAFLDFHK